MQLYSAHHFKSFNKSNKSAASMQNTSPRDIFQCKENHFETRPFHAKFEENR